MKLEAVIVCKNYSDFLAHSLPENVQYFDDVVVVTAHDDYATQKLCARYSVDYVKTEAFTEGGHIFNKGKAINLGLSHLPKNGWMLHLDADIVLPHRFRHMLDRAHLEEKNIYGADRVNVYGGIEVWENVKKKTVPHYSEGWFVDPGFCHERDVPPGCKFGARVVHMEHSWIPIGFFQLWHREAGAKYNYKLGAAAGSDCIFPAQWPRRNRVLLPEVVCWHLDSENEHGIGTNWKGRKSIAFCPCHDGFLPHELKYCKHHPHSPLCKKPHHPHHPHPYCPHKP